MAAILGKKYPPPSTAFFSDKLLINNILHANMRRHADAGNW
jgi:hypothetical protein